MTDKTQRKIFYHLSAVFFIGGVIAFLSQYFSMSLSEDNVIVIAVKRGGPISSIGVILFLVQQIKSEKIRSKLNIGVLLVSIPIVTLAFIEFSGATIWVVPIIIMTSSLVFNNRFLLVSSAAIGVITQRFIWIYKPVNQVVIDGYDYIFRIGIIMVTFFLGVYVNKIYVSRLKENSKQITFQKLNSEISHDLISINQHNFDEKVNRLLLKIGAFFDVDRTYLFLMDDPNKKIVYSNDWAKDEVDLVVEPIDMSELHKYDWWLNEYQEKRIIFIEDVVKLSDEAKHEQDLLRRQNVKSLIVVPIGEEKKLHGFIGLDSIHKIKVHYEDQTKQLIILANLLASGLTKLKVEKEIETMAYYDKLTGLPNRVLFSAKVEEVIGQEIEAKQPFSLLFLDLDNFKSVNDTMGHRGGDYLLKQVAKKLEDIVGDKSVVARFGGDEFLILLERGLSLEQVTKRADQVLNLFQSPFDIYGQVFLITSSIGIATYPTDGVDTESLIKNADTAMYMAKTKGKNQYAYTTKEMKDELIKNSKLSSDLYYAIKQNQLVVYYQPQINLETQTIVGVEALLRWNQPIHGMISPFVFIPLAEKNGLINSIGAWVLKESCRQNKKRQDVGFSPLRIAVNLSGVQFMNPQIVEQVKDILSVTGLDPKYLELEITESIAVKEISYALETLNKLKELGITIAIDDFGTEYSSLNRLKQLPIDRIKIDMQFIQGIENSEKDKAITMVIINLAKSLNLGVMAEGVETQKQMEFLNQKMCDGVQGYYYYKPMPADDFTIILSAIDHESNLKNHNLKM